MVRDIGSVEEGDTSQAGDRANEMSVISSVGNPLTPYGIAYGLSTSGLFRESLCTPQCGWGGETGRVEEGDRADGRRHM